MGPIPQKSMSTASNEISDIRKEIQRLLGTATLRSVADPLAKAAILNVVHSIPMNTLVSLGFGSKGAIARAVAAHKAGRAIGKPGRPSSLSETSEAELSSFLSEQSSTGSLITAATIYAKVCCFRMPFIIHVLYRRKSCYQNKPYSM